MSSSRIYGTFIRPHRATPIEYHFPEARYQWFDLDSFQPQPASWSQSLPVRSVSEDREIATVKDAFLKAQKMNISETLIQPGNGPLRVVCQTSVTPDSCGRPQFLGNKNLALFGSHYFEVVPETGGDPLIKVSFRDDEWLGQPLTPSAGSKRFAVTIWTRAGGSQLLDISSHAVLKRIMVYDTQSRKKVFTLEARQQVKHASAFALSPDGSRLAVLADGVIYVYSDFQSASVPNPTP